MNCCSERKDPVYFALSMPIHARGWIRDPRLYVLFDRPTTKSYTLRCAIADIYGNVISDELPATIPANTILYSIDLGDFIDAQRIAKNIQPGVYTLVAGVFDGTTVVDKFYTIIHLVDSAISITPVPEIRDAIVIDKFTASAFRMSPHVPLPADERYQVWLVYRKGEDGRVVIYDGGLQIFDSGYHRAVRIKLVYKFTSIDQMFDFIFSNTFMPVHLARELMRELTTKPKAELIKPLMSIYVAKHAVPGFYGAVADTTKLEVAEEYLMFFGQFDWFRVFETWTAKLAVVGCIIGAGALAIATKGAGTPFAIALAKGCISGGLVFGGLGALIDIVQSFNITPSPSPPTPPSPPPAPPPPPTIPEYKEKFEESKKALEDLINQWCQQGRLTSAECDEALKHVSIMAETYYSTLKDMEDYAKKNWEQGYYKGYEEGYKKGQEEGSKKSLTYGLVGGGVGLVIGVLIGRR